MAFSILSCEKIYLMAKDYSAGIKWRQNADQQQPW